MPHFNRRVKLENLTNFFEIACLAGRQASPATFGGEARNDAKENIPCFLSTELYNINL